MKLVSLFFLHMNSTPVVQRAYYLEEENDFSLALSWRGIIGSLDAL